MAYSYKDHRNFVFTEKGQETFLGIRDRVRYLLKEAGAFDMTAATKGVTGSSWDMTACVDRLVELGEIEELTDLSTWGQYRVFWSGKKHNR